MKKSRWLVVIVVLLVLFCGVVFSDQIIPAHTDSVGAQTDEIERTEEETEPESEEPEKERVESREKECCLVVKTLHTGEKGQLPCNHDVNKFLCMHTIIFTNIWKTHPLNFRANR
ncbi:peptide deformylase 1B [Striga asiatica]|uniref:Peptide deformylase 1B n=1 Tax=Striga asiatica TaxID=4170 RepID=A0A5A7P950_STRAF|nr:peptide deformylase 1B [Striga asiatica]